MKIDKIEIPSNKSFGYFFTIVFAVIAVYFYYKGSSGWIYIFTTTSLVFLLLTVIKADLLLPLNVLWMRLGLLLGKIVSPVLMGIIFFGLIMPVALFMRLGGRDELRLKFKQEKSHWLLRQESFQKSSFKQQF